MNTNRISILAASILLLAGCGGAEEPADTSGSATSGSETGPSPVSVQRNVDLTPVDPAAGTTPCSLSTVFFTYDSADLDESSRDAIATAVECFRTRTPARLHLTGATDPRGTEEYNIVLGERRAETVRTYLTSLGVNAERIEVHSMGEETASGTDEEGWTRDRNVSATAEE